VSLLAFALSVLVVSSTSLAAGPTTRPGTPAAPAKLVLLTQSKGFVHDVVKRKGGAPSVVERTFSKLADESKLFEVEWTDDASTLTADRIASARVLVLYTTGDVPLDVKALDAWVTAGGTLVGVHCATDTLKQTPAYTTLIGGVFDGHPWTADKTVTIKTDEPPELLHPAAKPFAPAATFREEIYQFKDVDFDRVRVLMSLDMHKTKEPKRPLHVPVAWCKGHGKGKVFYTSLGHRQDVWENPAFQQHLIGAIRWGLTLEKGDATPNPDVHRVEDRLAKEAK
jgi:hypothetical protein